MARFLPAILAVFFLLATVLCLLAGSSLVFPRSPARLIWAIKPQDYAQLRAMGPLVAWGFLALALPMALAVWGCWRRRGWAWGLALAIFVVNGLADLARLIAGRWVEGGLGVAALGLILLVMTRPAARRAFRR
jgi:hypothetical protein